MAEPQLRTPQKEEKAYDKMANEGMAKVSAAASNLKGMFDNISTKVFNNTQEKNQGLQSQTVSSARDNVEPAPQGHNYGEHLRFSDDEDESSAQPRKV